MPLTQRVMSQPRTAIAPRTRHICSGTSPPLGSTPPPRAMLLGCSCDALAPRPPCYSRKNQHGETAAVSPRLQSRRRMPSPMGCVAYSFVCIMHACMYARLYVGMPGTHTHTHMHTYTCTCLPRMTAASSCTCMHMCVEAECTCMNAYMRVCAISLPHG